MTMKYIILLLMLPCAVFAQPKGATVIVVKHTTFPDGVRQLISKGFIIDRLDSTYKVVSTKPRLAKKSASDITLQLNERDSSLYITGVMNMKMSVNVGMFTRGGDNSTAIQFKGMKGSEMKLCWQAMDDFAKSFGREVEYKME
jgi:hypothetical protein